MNVPDSTRALCVILSILIAAPAGLAQTPPNGVSNVNPAVPPPLGIVILQGRNAVNSIPLLRSVAPVVEIRDQNDFPVEGATVVFTIPADGPAGSFAPGGTSFNTRSDARGQASAPGVIPKSPGIVEITVAATAGNRKGQIVIRQTNSAEAYAGPARPPTPFYKRKLFWAVVGAAAAGGIVAGVLAGGSGSKNSPVVITTGPPVFQ